MSKPSSKTSTKAITALMASVLLTTGSLALADHHGGKRGHGHHDKEEMCQHFREGTGPFDHEQRREKMQQHHEDIAERLQLSAEQRAIWDDIRDERQAKHQKRHARMHEKMQERCNETAQ